MGTACPDLCPAVGIVCRQDTNYQRLKKELTQLHYSKNDIPEKPGEYDIRGQPVTAFTAVLFIFPIGATCYAHQADLHDKTITALSEPGSIDEGSTCSALEPVQYASIYPNHNEDRVLIKLADAPELLIKILLLIEDRQLSILTGVSGRRRLSAPLWLICGQEKPSRAAAH